MSSPREVNYPQDRFKRTGKSAVAADLKRFGPDAPMEAIDEKRAKNYCKSLALLHYENFSVASFLLPASLRQDFYNIYAYCRWSDDLADEMANSAESLRLLSWWRTELRECFAGKAKHPVFVALVGTIRSHQLAVEPFEHLLDAFVQDQSVMRYDSHMELIDYCRGSANPVGRILLRVAKVDDPKSQELSDRICTGLQIANFCQDIRQDALMGRIYLPKILWERFGFSEREILAGQPTDPLKLGLKVWVEMARTFLITGLPLVRQTPRWLARDLQLFVRGGLTILDNIEKKQFDVWTRPIEVSKMQKATLLLRAILSPRSLRVSCNDMSRGSQ